MIRSNGCPPLAMTQVCVAIGGVDNLLGLAFKHWIRLLNLDSLRRPHCCAIMIGIPVCIAAVRLHCAIQNGEFYELRLIMSTVVDSRH